MITIGGVTAQRTSFRFAYLECDAVSFFPKSDVIFLWDTFNGYDLLEDKIPPTITDSNICAIAPTCPGRSHCSSCPENRKQFEFKKGFVRHHCDTFQFILAALVDTA
jgi:hypothetical protein